MIKKINKPTYGTVICIKCNKTIGYYEITDFSSKPTKYNYCKKHKPKEIIKEPEEKI